MRLFKKKDKRIFNVAFNCICGSVFEEKVERCDISQSLNEVYYGHNCPVCNRMCYSQTINVLESLCYDNGGVR